MVLVNLTDRSWAMAESRKQDIARNSSLRLRASHHVVGRLRKAVSWSAQLCAIVREIADKSTQTEAECYHAEMLGRYAMQLRRFAEAKDHFSAARALFGKMQDGKSGGQHTLCASRLSKIEDLYHQCQIYLHERPDELSIIAHSADATARWGSHNITFSPHEIAATHKAIQTLKEKHEFLRDSDTSARGPQTVNRRIEVYDKVINMYTEAIEMCAKSIEAGHSSAEVMQMQQNYFLFQRLRMKGDRTEAYIKLNEDRAAKAGKRYSMQTNCANLMFLYTSLASASKDASMIPGLELEMAKRCQARALWASGGALYYKGLAWRELSEEKKSLLCIFLGLKHVQESLTLYETPRASSWLRCIRGEYVRKILPREEMDSLHSKGDTTKVHEKNCMLHGIETRCTALVPQMPDFKPLVPKLAFYDCAHSLMDVPELHANGQNVVEKGPDGQAGWFGGWFS